MSFVYPELCQCCEAAVATVGEGYVCGTCRRQVRWIQPPFCERCGLPFQGEITARFECGNCRELELDFVQARSAVAARGLVLDVVHRFKYDRALWFEPFLAELLVTAAASEVRSSGWDWVVPVPLHPAKESEREFNQAERLGRHLARAAGLPLRRVLRRVQPTRTQTHLSRGERAENVRGAFVVKSPADLPGKRVVLVDDVLTTGATTSACARVLRAGGAAEVCVWTVARGLLS